MSKIQHQQAVGEAFGYYFDENGKTIQRVHSIGISRERLTDIEHVITVAGGASKSKAISAYFNWGKSDVLVIDEALAKKMLSDKGSARLELLRGCHIPDTLPIPTFVSTREHSNPYSDPWCGLCSDGQWLMVNGQ
jgi:hypothetical protein